MSRKGPSTDIGWWQARYTEGEINWNKLRFITYCKYESMNTRPCRFFMDEVGFEWDLEELRRIEKCR